MRSEMADPGMPSSGPRIWELIHDPAFQELLRRSTDRCLSWDAFLSLGMPKGLSPLHAWELLNQLGRFTGIEIPVLDLNDDPVWFRRTNQLSELNEIMIRACSTDSHLDRIMASTGSQHFLMNVRIAETIAAIRLDGLWISMEDANTLLRLDRKPGNATERILLNTFAAVHHLPDMRNEPFSRDLFRHLGDLLLEGVDTTALARTRAPLGTGPFEWPDELTERYADRQMDDIAAFLNHETGTEQSRGLFRALILSDTFRFYRPLKEISSQVGRLVAHLYGLKQGLPVLGLLPASFVKLEWDAGHILPPTVSFDRPTFEDLFRRYAGDITCIQTLTMQLSLVALRIVERYVSDWEKRDQEMRRILKEDNELNDRQRAILGRALRKPEAEFTIRYHMSNHGISYPTARLDFLELVERGYLELEQVGKKFVFTPSHGLQGMFTDQSTLARIRGLDVELRIPADPPDNRC